MRRGNIIIKPTEFVESKKEDLYLTSITYKSCEEKNKIVDHQRV